MATGLIGGFAQGLASGMALRSSMDDAEQRRALALEQNSRDKKRFEFETAENEEKAKRRKQIADAEAELNRVEEMLHGGGLVQSQPQGALSVTEQAAAPQPRGLSTVPNEAAAATSAEQPAKPSNPFLTGFEKYENKPEAMARYYDLKGAALTKLYRAQGQYDKAEAVPELMRQLRDSNWSEKVGASLSAMVANAPGAREAFAKTYGLFADGYQLDPSKGAYDPNKGWVGLERINDKGEREKFNLSPEMAMTLASRFKKPDEVIKFVLDRGDKGRAEARADRATAADEKRADAAVIQAGASVTQAKATQARYEGLTKREDEARKGADQKAIVEAVGKLFPFANKEYKEEEWMAKSPTEQERLTTRQEQEARMMNKTLDLVALNPKIDVATLASIARRGTAQAQKDADGRVFTMIGARKVFLQ